jgi:hypothetical protein
LLLVAPTQTRTLVLASMTADLAAEGERGFLAPRIVVVASQRCGRIVWAEARAMEKR